MTLNKWSILGGLIGLALAVWYIRDDAYNEGLAAARLECSEGRTQQAADALNQFIAGARQLTTEANKASNALAAQVAARQTADEQSTRELKDALKKTASQRVKCVFDDGVMQLLREARERAATAAADGLSGGDDREVPASGRSGR